MATKRTAALAALGLSVGVGIVMACGGSEGTPAPATTPDAAPTSTTTAPPTTTLPAEGGPPPDAGTTYTLDNICEKTAPLLCDIRKSCCGALYNEGGCLAYQKAQCALDVAAAKAGKSKFHPDRVEACIPKLREILSQCSFTFELLQKHYKDIAGCQIFDGDVPVGGGCERTSQCVPATKKNEMPSCDDKTKKCKVVSFLKEGDTCRLGDGLEELCDKDLYCDIEFTDAAPLKGVCKKTTSIGVNCDKTKTPVQLECGLGNYCDLGTGKCTVGRAGGVTCNGNGFECASVQCTAADAGADAASPPGTCVPLGTLNKPEECKGL